MYNVMSDSTLKISFGDIILCGPKKDITEVQCHTHAENSIERKPKGGSRRSEVD